VSDPVQTDLAQVRIMVAAVALHALLVRGDRVLRVPNNLTYVNEAFAIADKFMSQAEQK